MEETDMATAKCGCGIGWLGANHDPDCSCTHQASEPDLVCQRCKKTFAPKDAVK
jgi:hypothetical protein